MNKVNDKAIGLALSGGGVRAAAFHAGVLQYLAEQGLLEKIVHVSSVSGGSLFVGAVFQYGKYRWPSSETYQSEVFPHIRQILTTKSLQRSAIFRLIFNPLNWRYILSRANVMAQAIENLWDIEAPLNELGKFPVWSINCTTGETGKRYRFKSGEMGDYELGYANVEKFSLAKAMAISAAFPGGIGPLTIDTRKFSWMKQEDWNNGERKNHFLPFNQLHLYDGGLYDNLGIEPLFDIGSQKIKQENINFILVSDGGAPLSRQTLSSPLNPLRFKRIADIALDQCRALRVRCLVNFLKRNPKLGAYIMIGSPAKESIRRYAEGCDESIVSKLLREEWLPATDANLAATYSTTLGLLTEKTFKRLTLHGYETAKWNIEMMLNKKPLG